MKFLVTNIPKLLRKCLICSKRRYRRKKEKKSWELMFQNHHLTCRDARKMFCKRPEFKTNFWMHRSPCIVSALYDNTIYRYTVYIIVFDLSADIYYCFGFNVKFNKHKQNSVQYLWCHNKLPTNIQKTDKVKQSNRIIYASWPFRNRWWCQTVPEGLSYVWRVSLFTAGIDWP